MYESVERTEFLATPWKFAWNIVVREFQFTQEELVAVKEYLDLPTLIRFQRCLTRPFLEAHFGAEIDACLEVDWYDIEKIMTDRASNK